MCFSQQLSRRTGEPDFSFSVHDMTVTCSLVYQVFLPSASYQHFEDTYVPSTLNVLINEGIQDFVETEAAKSYGRNRLRKCYVSCIHYNRPEGFYWFVSLGGKRHNAALGHHRGLHLFLKQAILHRLSRFFDALEANEDFTLMSTIDVRAVNSVVVGPLPPLPPRLAPVPPPNAAGNNP